MAEGNDSNNLHCPDYSSGKYDNYAASARQSWQFRISGTAAHAIPISPANSEGAQLWDLHPACRKAGEPVLAWANSVLFNAGTLVFPLTARPSTSRNSYQAPAAFFLMRTRSRNGKRPVPDQPPFDGLGPAGAREFAGVRATRRIDFPFRDGWEGEYF